MKNLTSGSLAILLCLFFTGTLFNFSEAQDWNEIIKRRASDPQDYDYYGRAISISGNYAIVGASQEDEDSEEGNYMYNAGSAYILYKDEGGTNEWAEVKKLVASDRYDGDRFGFSVSISGNYAIVGAVYEDEDTAGLNKFNSAGSAYIFYKDKDGPDNWG